VIVSRPLSSPTRISIRPEDARPQETMWISGARIGLVALLCAAPLAFGAVQVWAWSALAVVSVGLLFFWGIGCACQKALTIRWSPLYAPALLFLLLCVIQFLVGLSLDKVGTREALIKLTTYLLLFFLGGQLFATASPRVWRGFGLIVTVYAFALSVFAIAQFFSSPDLLYWSIKPRWGGAIFGPYVNRSDYAGLMEMLLPIAGAYLLGQTGRHPLRWLGVFAVLVAFASVELSGARGGLISLLIEMGLFGVFFGRSRLFGRRNTATAAAVAIVSVVALLLWIAPQEILSRYQTLVKSPDLTLGTRTQMAMGAFRLFRDNPWIGTGIGSLETAYPRYQSVFPEGVIQHAHNDFVELMAETGIVGLMLALVGLQIFFATAFRKVKLKFDHLADWIRLGSAVGCCGVLAHSFTDFNLHIPANAAWFVACMAISQPHTLSKCKSLINDRTPLSRIHSDANSLSPAKG